MSGNRTAQPQADGNERFSIQQAGLSGEQTWEGGGREPVHPDDIDDDGEFAGMRTPKQQCRSDDN